MIKFQQWLVLGQSKHVATIEVPTKEISMQSSVVMVIHSILLEKCDERLSQVYHQVSLVVDDRQGTTSTKSIIKCYQWLVIGEGEEVQSL